MRQPDRLAAYQWPGNVRELRNVIARAVALSAPGTRSTGCRSSCAPRLRPSDRAQADRPFHEAKTSWWGASRGDLEDLMRKSGGRMAEAARRAGLERKYLYRLLERVGIERPRE